MSDEAKRMIDVRRADTAFTERLAARMDADKVLLARMAGKPCPATTTAILGFPEPTLIPCGDVEGHAGWHRYEITWDTPAPSGKGSSRSHHD